MPTRCVAAGCGNTSKDGTSMHNFPKDEKYRKIWTTKVKLTRAKWSGPTPSSKLCSDHFKPECFEPIASLQDSFGMKFKRLLKPDIRAK